MNIFLGEVVGTMFLIMLGDGVVANVLLGKTKGNNSGWIVITTAWAMAVFVGVFVSLGLGGNAHLNPAVTLTFWRLGKVKGWDALFYIAAQFIGGVAGVGIAAAALGMVVAHPAVRYAATVPGRGGSGVAFGAEFIMTFVLMTVILRVSNRPGLNRFTGLFAAALVTSYIILEAPLSGMSLNPARCIAC